MAKPFDATMNRLIDVRPEDWVGFLAPRVGLTPGRAEVLDTDLSTTSQADKLFRLLEPEPALLHLELEANHRLGIPEDLLHYNVLAGHANKQPVYSVLLLLRPNANATDQTGHYRRPWLEFTYAVIRIWQEPLDALLSAGPTLAPLALLTDEAARDLGTAFGRFTDRLQSADVTGNLKDELLSSTYVLGGLRYEESRLIDLYRRFSMLLEDSTTYQGIIKKGMAAGRVEGEAEGKASEARHLLLVLGQKRFGAMPRGMKARLSKIADGARLERMAERILDAADWNDLIATP